MSSNLRKIAPLFEESSASTSTPNTSQSNSGGSSNPRQGSGSEPASGVYGSDHAAIASAASITNASKRRRVPDQITRNACGNCKKARTKCDGSQPCKRCKARDKESECVYERHIKHAKEELIKEIKDLKNRDHLTEQILQALSTDEDISGILEQLRNGGSYESIVESLGRAPVADTLSPYESQHSTFEASDDHDLPSTGRWTSVISEGPVLDHLFQLYFSWVHPVHTLFNEGLFVESYNHHSETFCSTVLVNAICAMACHLHTSPDKDETDYKQLGRAFRDSARASIDEETHNITTIQALAVMFLEDSASGHGLRGAVYLQEATYALKAAVLPGVVYQRVNGFAVVMRDTICGLRNLNIEWAQMTFQAPIVFPSVLHDTIEENDAELDSLKWHFYTQVEYGRSECPAYACRLATTNRQKSKLVAIIQDVTTMMYERNGPPISASWILRQYARLMTWRNEVPERVGDTQETTGQALPHALSLLILFNCSVVLLLRPLLDCETFEHRHAIGPVIWHHAQKGLLLLNKQYRHQYSFQYQPVLQMFAILHLTDLVARFFPGRPGGLNNQGAMDGPEAMLFGTEALMESRNSFPVAGPFEEMLRKTASHIRIDLSEEGIGLKPAQPKYTTDDFISACTRRMYTQPVQDIHAKYNPSLSTNWALEGPSFGFPDPSQGNRQPSAEEMGAQSLMQIRNLLNRT